jgi:putative ABC transport system substrate-binding protein
MGLVESLRRPGGNMTGTCQQLMLLTPKFFELLREMKPGGKRGGVLIKRSTTTAEHMKLGRTEMESASAKLGLEIVEIVTPDDPTLEEVRGAIERAKVDYLFVPEDLYFKPVMPRLIEWLARARLPALYLYPSLVKDGGLISMSYDIEEGFRAGIEMVTRILRGESPATMPVYMSTRYRIAVNRRTARTMGLDVPAGILTRADEVVD